MTRDEAISLIEEYRDALLDKEESAVDRTLDPTKCRKHLASRHDALLDALTRPTQGFTYKELLDMQDRAHLAMDHIRHAEEHVAYVRGMARMACRASVDLMALHDETMAKLRDAP